jgi:hypothetical protein
MENFNHSDTQNTDLLEAAEATDDARQGRNVRSYRNHSRMSREKAIRTGVWAYAAAIAIFHTAEPALEAMHETAHPVDTEVSVVQEYQQPEFTEGAGPIDLGEATHLTDTSQTHHEDADQVHIPPQQAPDGHFLELVQRQQEEDHARMQVEQETQKDYHLAA